MNKKNIEKLPVILFSILLITSIIALVPTVSASVSGYTIVSVAQTGVNEITVVIGGTYCGACNPNNGGNPGCTEFTHGPGGTWDPGETGYYMCSSLINGRYSAACIGYGSPATYVTQKFICTSANWPLTVFTTHAFVFSGIPISGGDTINVYGELYCSWCGHWYAAPQSITVMYGPAADAGGPYTGYENIALILDGSGSYHTDPGGTHYITTYEWDLDNDGQYDDATGVSPSHTWTTAGTYTIGLRVTDDQGLIDTDEATVTIIELIPVDVDIKPGSCPNPINPKSKGVLPVAICGTEDFDVTTIDPDTIQLTREGEIVFVDPIHWSYEDVATPFEGELCDCHELEGDEYTDLTLKFKIQEVNDLLSNADLNLEIPLKIIGNLKEEHGGTPIEGQDCVWVIKPLEKNEENSHLYTRSIYRLVEIFSQQFPNLFPILRQLLRLW